MGVIYVSRLWDIKRLALVRRPKHIIGAATIGVVVGVVLSIVIVNVQKSGTAVVLASETTNAREAPFDQSDAVQKLLPIGNNFTNLPFEIKPAPPPPAVSNCAFEACVALSFDDGPDPINTPKILDVLDKEQIKATFFLIGYRVQPNAAVVQRMYREGFEIGNHSWSHPNFLTLSPAQIQDQLNKTQAAITSLGIPPPTLFRPPYGAINNAVRAQIHMAIIRWDVDPKDWNKTDPASVIAAVEAQAKPGAIILMHSTKAATADALETVIDNLKTRFHLVTVTQLLQLAPEAQGEYIGR